MQGNPKQNQPQTRKTMPIVPPAIPDWVSGLGEDALLLPGAAALSRWTDEVSADFGRTYLAQHPPDHKTAQQVLVSVIGTEAASTLGLSADPKLLHEPYLTASIRSELRLECATKLRKFMDEQLQRVLGLPTSNNDRPPPQGEPVLSYLQTNVEQPQISAFEEEVKSLLSNMISSAPANDQSAVIAEVLSSVFHERCLDLRSGLDNAGNPIAMMDNDELNRSELNDQSTTSSFRTDQLSARADGNAGLDPTNIGQANAGDRDNSATPGTRASLALKSAVKANESTVWEVGMKAIECQFANLCLGRSVPVTLVRHLMVNRFIRADQVDLVAETTERHFGARTSTRGVSRLDNMITHAVNEAYDTTLARYDIQGNRAMSIKVSYK
jgi:hypothetical protein